MDPFEDTVTDTLESTEIVAKSNQRPGFIEHVFVFDKETKITLLNLLQYTILAIIPITILIKFLGHYVPDADESKNNPEIAIEVLLQVVVIIFGIFYIHRLVTYIPMYSGVNIGSVSFVNIILGFLVLLLSIQSKLGEKVQILSERFLDFVYGTQTSNNLQKENVIKVSQPLTMVPPIQPQEQHQQMPITPHQPHQSMSQNNSSFDSMYREQMTNNIGGGNGELMAANEIGSSFSSW